MTVRYTGVVLSRNERLNLLNTVFPLMQMFFERLGYVTADGSKIYCHHMTMNLGTCREKELIGREVGLTVDAFGISDKVMAVRVAKREPDVYCDNETPHITIAVHKERGAAKDSNLIKEWIPLTSTPKFVGTVQEVY